MPLSRMQTRTPAPVASPQAHARVTASGQRVVIRSTASDGTLHAGSSSGSPIQA